MTPIEWTCICTEDLEFNNYQFLKGHEYQVDIYPLFYKIYNNGGYDDYIFIDGEDNFNKNFKMIK